MVLDVGCAESLLAHELVAKGFRVIGLDIRDYPFKNSKVFLLEGTCLIQVCLMVYLTRFQWSYILG